MNRCKGRVIVNLPPRRSYVRRCRRKVLGWDLCWQHRYDPRRTIKPQ